MSALESDLFFLKPCHVQAETSLFFRSLQIWMNKTSAESRPFHGPVTWGDSNTDFWANKDAWCVQMLGPSPRSQPEGSVPRGRRCLWIRLLMKSSKNYVGYVRFMAISCLILLQDSRDFGILPKNDMITATSGYGLKYDEICVEISQIHKTNEDHEPRICVLDHQSTR